MGKVNLKTSSQQLISIYEILICMSILFGADQKSKISETALETCLQIISLVQEHLEEIQSNDDVLDAFLNNNLIKWICSGLNFDSVFKINRKKNKLMLIQTIMYEIQGDIFNRLSKKISVAANVNRFIADTLK